MASKDFDELKLSNGRSKAYIEYINKKLNRRLDCLKGSNELTEGMLNIAIRKALDELYQHDIYESIIDDIFDCDGKELYIDTDDDIAIFL